MMLDNYIILGMIEILPFSYYLVTGQYNIYSILIGLFASICLIFGNLFMIYAYTKGTAGPVAGIV